MFIPPLKIYWFHISSIWRSLKHLLSILFQIFRFHVTEWPMLKDLKNKPRSFASASIRNHLLGGDGTKGIDIKHIASPKCQEWSEAWFQWRKYENDKDEG